MPIEFTPKFLESRWTHKRQVPDKLKFAILAAGLGRRMDPLTARHLPKPLFPLGGKVPMAEVWLRRAVESGITDVSMNLCVLAQIIENHFGDGGKFGANLTYVREDVPSGTLGGVCKQALGMDSKRLPSEKHRSLPKPFQGSTLIVPSGDIVTNFGSELLEEMYEIHRGVGSALTVALVPVPWERRIDYGTAVLASPEARDSILCKSGRIESFVEKQADSPSNLSNASIYMIEMDLLRALDPLRTEANLDVANPFYDFGKHVFPALLGDLPYVSLPKDFVFWGVQYNGSWFDVGQKRDYLRVNELLLDGKLDVPLPYEKLPWGYLGRDVEIDFSSVKIIPPVVIGNNCVIELGATLGPYAVIGDDWTVQREARIQHSVLWERYSYFDEDGNEVPARHRKLIDRHTVRTHVSIDESIVAGGDIEFDLLGKTVDVQADGGLGILDIDSVADGPRA
ncbi:MAG TPA: NDP-sugar synthase [Terriglobales bacterium]